MRNISSLLHGGFILPIYGACSDPTQVRLEKGNVLMRTIFDPHIIQWAVRPALLVHHVWTHAVTDEGTIRLNVRLLTVLTAIFSLPGIAQGVLMLAHAPAVAARGYGAYILALGLMEFSGALLLARCVLAGRALIAVAAAGFYLEAALGLAGLERTLLAAAIFTVCAPAEAWVLWFLCHPRVRAYLVAHGQRDGVTL